MNKLRDHCFLEFYDLQFIPSWKQLLAGIWVCPWPMGTRGDGHGRGSSPVILCGHTRRGKSEPRPWVWARIAIPNLTVRITIIWNSNPHNDLCHFGLVGLYHRMILRSVSRSWQPLVVTVLLGFYLMYKSGVWLTLKLISMASNFTIVCQH